jgi:hypothetical protein
MEVIFKNYCMVVLGNTDGCECEIKNISETNPNIVNMNGVALCTFTTIATINELNDYFKSFGRNFFLFVLDPSLSCCNINNRHMYAILFSEFENYDGLQLEELGIRLNEELGKDFNGTKIKKDFDDPETLIDSFSDLSKSDKELIINEILDKGVKNMTDDDKIILAVFSDDK